MTREEGGVLISPVSDEVPVRIVNRILCTIASEKRIIKITAVCLLYCRSLKSAPIEGCIIKSQSFLTEVLSLRAPNRETC